MLTAEPDVSRVGEQKVEIWSNKNFSSSRPCARDLYVYTYIVRRAYLSSAFLNFTRSPSKRVHREYARVYARRVYDIVELKLLSPLVRERKLIWGIGRRRSM